MSLLQTVSVKALFNQMRLHDFIEASVSLQNSLFLLHTSHLVNLETEMILPAGRMDLSLSGLHPSQYIGATIGLSRFTAQAGTKDSSC